MTACAPSRLVRVFCLGFRYYRMCRGIRKIHTTAQAFCPVRRALSLYFRGFLAHAPAFGEKPGRRAAAPKCAHSASSSAAVFVSFPSYDRALPKIENNRSRPGCYRVGEIASICCQGVRSNAGAYRPRRGMSPEYISPRNQRR